MRVTAPFGRRRVAVTAVEDVGPYRVLHADDPQGPAPWPGQFYMLAAAERWGAGEGQRPFLPRAFSYLSAADGALSFMLEDVGPGTRRLAELRPGDGLAIMGPLGIGFAAPAPGRRALLAGGGVGIPPLGAWAAHLRDGGHAADVVLGFRDAARAEAAALIPGAHVATDDGSAGHAGPVTDLLAAELDEGSPATVFACGPPGMLEAVRALCAERAVPAELALEAGMACGYGACYGCVVAVRGGGYVRLCVDGPVLDADRLDAVPVH